MSRLKRLNNIFVAYIEYKCLSRRLRRARSLCSAVYRVCRPRGMRTEQNSTFEQKSGFEFCCGCGLRWPPEVGNESISPTWRESREKSHHGSGRVSRRCGPNCTKVSGTYGSSVHPFHNFSKSIFFQPLGNPHFSQRTSAHVAVVLPASCAHVLLTDPTLLVAITQALTAGHSRVQERFFGENPPCLC